MRRCLWPGSSILFVSVGLFAARTLLFKATRSSTPAGSRFTNFELITEERAEFFIRYAAAGAPTLGPD
jgi:hypothetical protein